MFIRKVDRHEDVPLEETLTVDTKVPHRVLLRELPQADSVKIGEMIEVGFLPQQETQFFVDYATASIWFHSKKADKEVKIKYAAIGSVLRSDDLNQIYDAIEELQAIVRSLTPSLK